MMKILLLLALSLPAAWARPSVVNDVTQINPITVDREERPRSAEEVQRLVKEWPGPVSIGGGRFSMGGQTASEHTLHLDMRAMNKVLAFDAAAKTITVQPGITWRRIQEYVDPHNLSVKIMQSYANFTVGGSLSVNVHGRYVGLGPLVMSVRGIKLVLADGSLISASPSENAEIFYGAVGGYGGLGVIVEASLDLADDVKIEREVRAMSLAEYRDYFFKEVRDNKRAIFHNGDIYPPYYDRVTSVTWQETDKPVTVPDRIMPITAAGWRDRVALFGITEVPFGKELRANFIEPARLNSKPIVWRNYEASYDVGSLEPASRTKSTYVLEEYFVPVKELEKFAKKMGEIFTKHNANILNVSIRHAQKDPGVLLAWAREEVFAFVIYYKQGTSQSEREKVGVWTRELIDAAISMNGAYYLPYQLHATSEQFKKAYPQADKYFALKAKLDPDYRFRNKLWDKYYGPSQRPFALRPEEQTFLTLPEWYVVFSADELAHQFARGPPSSFPWFRAVGQFWGLHKDVTRATFSKYPTNWGYHVMVGVVGVSFTVEYVIRGLYEISIGRLTEEDFGSRGAEDEYLAKVAGEYGRFIHVTPWYEFPFRQKLSEFWRVPPKPGTSAIRRWERRFAGTLELGGKAAWGWVIRKATGAAYAPEDAVVEALVGLPKGKIIYPDGVKVVPVDRFSQRLILPRYEAFTLAASNLLRQGLRFMEIAGNKKIALTLIAPRGWAWPETEGQLIREWPVLTEPGRKRVAGVVEIERLDTLLPQWEKSGLKLDHLYDY